MVQRIKAVAVFMGAKRLPFKAIKVTKDENGERVIEGVKPFVDSFPDIPFGKRNHRGDWITFTRAEREAIHLIAKAKAERAAKKAAKAEKPKTPPPVVKSWKEAMAHIAESQIGTVEAKSFPDMPVEYRTVLRGGKWCQVGADNLTAHIVNR